MTVRRKASPTTADAIRCPWAKTEQYSQYHDEEWGVSVHDDLVDCFRYEELSCPKNPL